MRLCRSRRRRRPSGGSRASKGPTASSSTAPLVTSIHKAVDVTVWLALRLVTGLTEREGPYGMRHQFYVEFDVVC
eukprot:4714827-Pyramimonas_sp.AAC.1